MICVLFCCCCKCNACNGVVRICFDLYAKYAECGTDGYSQDEWNLLKRKVIRIVYEVCRRNQHKNKWC